MVVVILVVVLVVVVVVVVLVVVVLVVVVVVVLVVVVEDDVEMGNTVKNGKTILIDSLSRLILFAFFFLAEIFEYACSNCIFINTKLFRVLLA